MTRDKETNRRSAHETNLSARHGNRRSSHLQALDVVKTHQCGSGRQITRSGGPVFLIPSPSRWSNELREKAQLMKQVISHVNSASRNPQLSVPRLATKQLIGKANMARSSLPDQCGTGTHAKTHGDPDSESQREGSSSSSIRRFKN